MIIDAHAHIFPEIRGMIGSGPTRGCGFGRVRIGSKEIQALPPLCEQTRHTPEMLLGHMEWAGVHGSVLLQGPFYGECNDYVLAAIRSHPRRFAGAAYVDPWDAHGRAMFDWVVSANVFRAVKLECSEATGYCGIHAGAELADSRLRWLWDELERHSMVLVVDLGAIGSASYQTRSVQAIAGRHPGLKIVVCHLGQPNPNAEANPRLWKLWEEQVDLGRMPNVWFDTASLPAYLEKESYPYPLAARYLRTAVERIGPARLLWGSDIPGLLTHATYAQLLDVVRAHTDYLSDDDRSLILGKNAAVVFGLELE